MINVDVIYSTWLTNHVGPSKSLTRFSKNTDFFDKNDISLRIVTADMIYKREFSQSKQSFKSKIRSKLISFVVFLSDFNSRLMWWVVQSKYLRHSEKIVSFYGTLPNKSNTIVFHELFTAYYFLNSKFYDKKRHKVILYHHANGEMFKMLCMYYPLLEKSKYMSRLYEIQEFTLDRIDKLVFISNNARLNFLNLNTNFNENKTDFIHNGIEDLSVDEKLEMESFRSKSNRNYLQLTCAGTINSRKGQEMLVRALSKIELAKRERIRVWFLGNGPQKNYLENLVTSLGLSENVVFTGGVDNVNDYLFESDIFILPSKDEGLPISIIEAMRASLPIISTTVAGIPEMINHERNGLLIAPTEESIFNALNALDKYDWKMMGATSRQIYEDRFTLKKMINGYCSVIKRTV